MKRVFVLMVFTIMAIGASAQVTYNVRAGIGGMNTHTEDSFDYPYWDHHCDLEMTFSCGVMAQANIPFNKHGKFSFSPTVLLDLSEEYKELYVPLFLGYKIGIGHKKLFFPKIGAAFVYTNCNEAQWGVTTDLAFEFNHLVIGVFGCATVESDEGHCIFATIGYKF